MEFRALDLRRTIALSVAGFALASNPTAFSQPVRTSSAEITNVQVVGTHPNTDNQDDLIVTLSITIQALDRPVVVPNCAEGNSPLFFCVAQLTRRNGKVVPVRKHLAATMGFPNPDQWKPVFVQAGSSGTFQFAYSTGLLDVRPCERLRVKLQIWPGKGSMKDWKVATTLLTPAFRNPSKAN